MIVPQRVFLPRSEPQSVTKIGRPSPTLFVRIHCAHLDHCRDAVFFSALEDILLLCIDPAAVKA